MTALILTQAASLIQGGLKKRRGITKPAGEKTEPAQCVVSISIPQPAAAEKKNLS
ncbi:MAG: hypothetical protein HFF18_00680 [Oscillospiraceae bacterium]|nr:hypothetical protein [Oscillospiraceae bacterium]